MCNSCWEALKKRGYITYSGWQIQENFHVPNCYPGIVYVRGEEVAPNAAKFATVVVEPGQIRVDWNLTREVVSFGKVGKKWDDFYVSDLAKLPKTEQAWTHALAGIASSGCRPMVSGKGPYNQGKALLGRVFRQPAERSWGRGPLPGVWRWAEQFVDELLPDFHAEKMSVPDWIATMPSRRRGPLRKAAANYARVGWRHSYRRFSSFVKKELLPGFSKTDCELGRLDEMLDRLIQGPKDETHVIAGPHLKPLIAKLKEIWTHDAPIFYGSVGPEALHKWLHSRLIGSNLQYFWCDFSMYDNTHSEDSWSFMENLYRRAGIDDADFWRVMDVWRKPYGKIGPFVYQANVMNASGRDDTALANGVLNGFATYLSICAAYLDKDLLTLTVEDLRACRDIGLSVCGDDSLGSLPYHDEQWMAGFRQRVAENISKFGFEAKLCTSAELTDAVYLGNRPYPAAGTWFWGRTIGRSTYKMGWVTTEVQRDIMAHITGIADMHLLCSSHVPILADLAKKIVQLREGGKRTPAVLDPSKPWEWTLRAGVEYDDSTIAAVASIYSKRGRVVTTLDVWDLISEIRGVARLPCVLDHWLWKLMIHEDDL